MHWGQVLAFHTPVLETIVRGTLVYLALFLMLRLVLKRESGTLAVTDLLVVVLIADAAQNAMAGGYRSVPDGLLLVGVILFWSYALNWLGFHVRMVEKLVQPPPLPLVKDGRLLYRNMRRELITEQELTSQLRLHGVDDLAQVRLAQMEGDGRISVVSTTASRTEAPDAPRA